VVPMSLPSAWQECSKNYKNEKNIFRDDQYFP